MNVQPFVILGARQRARALESLDVDLQTWLTQWMGPRASSQPAVVAEVEARDGDDQVEGLKFMTSDDCWCICSVGADDLHTLALQLLGSAVGAEVRSDSHVVRRFALASLCHLVATWIARQDEDIDPMPIKGRVAELVPFAARQAGRGVLSLTVSVGAAQILCWLPLTAMQTRIGMPATSRQKDAMAPVSVGRAVAGQQVGLSATIGDIDLSLEAVSQLRPGDVVRLEKPITAPLAMHIRGSDVGFSGYLGRQGDKLAFRVVEKL